jgi:hypothetical protein
MEILIAGFVAAAAIMFLILKFGRLRRILAFDKWIDIFTTVVVGIMFFGTFSGMMVAVTAGCIISAFLYFAKKIFGAEKLTLKGWREDTPCTVRNPFRRYQDWKKSWNSGSLSRSS